VIATGLEVAVLPAASLAVATALYVPAALYVFDTDAAEVNDDDVPSPKFTDHVYGAVPPCMVALKPMPAPTDALVLSAFSDTDSGVTAAAPLL
jgi:hypothetical protein